MRPNDLRKDGRSPGFRNPLGRKTLLATGELRHHDTLHKAIIRKGKGRVLIIETACERLGGPPTSAKIGLLVDRVADDEAHLIFHAFSISPNLGGHKTFFELFFALGQQVPCQSALGTKIARDFFCKRLRLKDLRKDGRSPGFYNPLGRRDLVYQPPVLWVSFSLDAFALHRVVDFSVRCGV